MGERERKRERGGGQTCPSHKLIFLHHVRGLTNHYNGTVCSDACWYSCLVGFCSLTGCGQESLCELWRAAWTTRHSRQGEIRHLWKVTAESITAWLVSQWTIESTMYVSLILRPLYPPPTWPEYETQRYEDYLIQSCYSNTPCVVLYRKFLQIGEKYDFYVKKSFTNSHKTAKFAAMPIYWIMIFIDI